MQPTPGDVHVNTPLSNISVAEIQSMDAFVADKVFPNISSGKQGDRYWTFDRGYFNRDEMQVRGPSTESAGGDYTVDNTPTFFCPVQAFHHDIDDQRRANEDTPLNADKEATILCTHKAMIRRELSWASKYFAASLWTTEFDGVASSPSSSEFLQWNDSGSDPIEVIRAQKTAMLKLTGVKPNTLVIGPEVYDSLIDHPDIIDRVKYGQTAPGIATLDTSDLAAVLKIPRVFVMEAVYNSAAQGATNVGAFIGGKSALLCHAAPSPGLMTPTAGYTFSWNGYLGASAMGGRISKFRMEQLKSDRVEIEMAFDQKLVAADMGCFFATAVA